jgi:putative autotransporter adhesin-like protein
MGHSPPARAGPRHSGPLNVCPDSVGRRQWSKGSSTGRAGTLKADASGASNLELADLGLEDLDIQLSGASRADVQAAHTIAAQLSGASRLTSRGTPQFTKRDTSGASTIQPAEHSQRTCLGRS